MPRAKRKRRARHTLAPNQVRMLTTGLSFTEPRWGVWHRVRNEYEIRAAWSEYRDELIDGWIAEHPFTRPLAFWLYDATQPRLRVVGEQLVEAREGNDAREPKYRSLAGFYGLNRRLGFEDTRGHEGEFESEKQYLARIGALTDSELALL